MFGSSTEFFIPSHTMKSFMLIIRKGFRHVIVNAPVMKNLGRLVELELEMVAIDSLIKKRE